ncbi:MULTISPECIES: class A beta-lactamase [unclassified Hyphomicrobium]|uniref:class A beta-lactamase n=1 Tax=unclassified Hyphomicrobium TaxID=2619925 RepID=UPI000213E704|nr:MULTISPECIES: class A beta-lactamase [unclassified Hyphomicrobium]CCB67763.1 Beta-lactamase AST-1 [Hyphomicrobium sp. MC1]
MTAPIITLFGGVLNRRAFILGTVALTASQPAHAEDNAFAGLEKQYGGRLGVAVVDTGSGERMAYRADERFPMCSTFKLLIVGAVLHNVDKGSERLDRWIPFQASDLLDYAPVTKTAVGNGGMTMSDLCAAAIEYGDNTAANLILKAVGGPDGATRYVRSLGDEVTRIDRFEPDANTCIPGDPRDTTTPAAMLADLKALVLGDALSANARTQLLGWLNGCKTAARRIPADLPAGWISGDKTGSGANGTANDVAIIQRPNKKPLLVAAYSTGVAAKPADRDPMLADVGRIVARHFGQA